VIAAMYESAPDINGRISFGKFVPYDEINIGVLCDVNNGEDLASILIENANKISI